jgi:predicted negative regulator of RcsB-dependent stress response
MNENILTWNVENWITVILMAAIGFMLLGLGQKWWQSHHGQPSQG